MRDALAKDSRLHRDISVANIVLVQEDESDIRRGYLIDWEASCRVDDAGDALEEGRAVSSSDLSVNFTLTPVIGHLAIYVYSHAPRRAGVLQAQNPGRYGIATLRRSLLRIVVATSQLLQAGTHFDCLRFLRRVLQTRARSNAGWRCQVRQC